VNYLLYLISLKSFEGRVRPENGNESQHLVLGNGYTLPSRVIIKLFGFVWNSEGGCWCLLALCSSFTAGAQNKILLYKTRETGACCTEQHLNGSVFFCYTKQEINMAFLKKI